jgi:hypothetical protein
MAMALEAFYHDVKVVCCRVVWQKAESPEVNFH